LGVPPSRVLKTLMATVDGKPVCVVVPSDREVAMKRLAAAFGGKSAQMVPPAEAERVTGYHVGGISPFGQRRPVPTIIEVSALEAETVFVNGGQRGLQVELSPTSSSRPGRRSRHPSWHETKDGAAKRVAMGCTPRILRRLRPPPLATQVLDARHSVHRTVSPYVATRALSAFRICDRRASHCWALCVAWLSGVRS
jgi:Cys-tRNA(Pro) deacylase